MIMVRFVEMKKLEYYIKIRIVNQVSLFGYIIS